MDEPFHVTCNTLFNQLARYDLTLVWLFKADQLNSSSLNIGLIV